MQEIQRFTATDDAGKPYTLVAYQEFAPARRGDPLVPTKKSLRTTEGDPINRLTKGLYQLLLYGRVTLTSSDPNAL
jgi:hypothetical protein